ncbi:MAG: DUF1801 domain-containing protein [Bacteroidia bacterium]
MKSTAKTVEEYIDELADDRKQAITELRKVIKKNLPKEFKEEMSYGMIGYVVPHSLYPKGYHCNPKLPLPFINLGSQKNFIALHHMGVYADTKLLDWFISEYAKQVATKLDMGKGCIRFKKMDQIPYKLIGELVTKVSAAQWMAVADKWHKK